MHLELFQMIALAFPCESVLGKLLHLSTAMTQMNYCPCFCVVRPNDQKCCYQTLDVLAAKGRFGFVPISLSGNDYAQLYSMLHSYRSTVQHASLLSIWNHDNACTATIVLNCPSSFDSCDD